MHWPAAGGRRQSPQELAPALAAGGRAELQLGRFREGLVLTRFLSEPVPTPSSGGTLVPFAEELPEPVLSELAES